MFDSFPQPEARLLILEDPAAVAREAARRFVAAAGRAVEAGAPFFVALSGGRTPLGTYRLLAGDDAVRHSIHWPSAHFFWGDERFVPPDHADSNYRAAMETFLGPLGIEADRIHPVPTGRADAATAARDYEETLRRVFAEPAGVPRFGLAILGLGTDGHTASLFPGARPPGHAGALVAAVARPEDGSPRVTLTPRVLNAANQVLFLVTGGDKAEILERVMRATEPDPALPATLIRPPRGNIAWLADRDAARRIIEESGDRQGGGGGG